MSQVFKINFSEKIKEILYDSMAERRQGIREGDVVSNNLDVLNFGIIKPGLRLPWFVHEDKDEIIIAIKGQAILYLKNQSEIEISAGEVIYVSKSHEHSLENNSDKNFEAIFIKIYS